jgi:hypothetical protein
VEWTSLSLSAGFGPGICPVQTRDPVQRRTESGHNRHCRVARSPTSTI